MYVYNVYNVYNVYVCMWAIFEITHTHNWFVVLNILKKYESQLEGLSLF